MTAQTRRLTGREAEAFRLGRLTAAERCPYFMHALFAVGPVAAPGLGTFAVDGQWRLYLDPALLDGEAAWDAVTIGAVLLHEVGHLIRDHAARAGVLSSPRNHLAWNLAGDAEINDDLIAAAVPLPDGAVTPAGLGCPDGDLAEAYYEHLRRDQGSLPDDGGAGCGSGSGCPAAPGELPAGVGLDAEAGVPLSPAEGDLIRRQVAHAVRQAAGAGRGTVPAGAVRWASQVLAPPTVRWQRLLRSAIRRSLAEVAGQVTYTYTRPSRRPLPAVVRPAMRAPVLRVAMVVDTSGSMSGDDLDAAMSEVNGVLRSSGISPEHVRIVSCDAAATSARRISRAAGFALEGGGGTDMRVGIVAAEQANPAPDVVIVFTDGDTPWPDAPGRARLVCAIISSHPPVNTPQWATTVRIPPSEKGNQPCR